MNWYVEVLKKYVVFTGRARRKEYWYFVLVNVLISIVLGVIDGVMLANSAEPGLGLLSSVYSLAVMIPSLAVGVRRLHDTDRSGWWLFLGLIPILGTIVLIVFLAQDSQPGQNRFGDNPKEASV